MDERVEPNCISAQKKKKKFKLKNTGHLEENGEKHKNWNNEQNISVVAFKIKVNFQHRVLPEVKWHIMKTKELMY